MRFESREGLLFDFFCLPLPPFLPFSLKNYLNTYFESRLESHI